MFNVNRLILLAFVLVVGVSATLARGEAGEHAAGAWDGAEYRLAQTLPNWAQGLSGATSKGEETKGEAGKAGSDAPAEGAAQKAGDGGSGGGSGEGEAAAVAAPQELPAQLEKVLQPVRRITSLLEDYEKTVERVKDRDEELARVRIDIDKIPGEARTAISAIEPRLAEIKAQIDKLGPAPKSGEPPESAEVAAERTRLNALSAELDGAIKSAELADVKARQLIGRVQDLRQAIFANQVLSRTKHSPLRPSLWQSVFDEMPNAGRELVAIAKGWWARASSRLYELAAIISLSLLIYFGLKIMRRRVFAARLTRPEGSPPPKFFERAAVASWVGPARFLPRAAAVLFLYVGLESSELLYLQTDRIAGVLLWAILIAIIVFSLSWAVLQPNRREWRLFNLSDASAERLHLIIRMVAVVFGVDLVLRDLVKMLYLPFQVSVAQAFVSTLVFAILLFALARTPLEPQRAAAPEEGAEPDTSAFPRAAWLKALLVLLAVFIGGAALSGYVALARFVSAQVLLTGTVAVVIMLMHLGIRAISGDSRVAGAEETGVGARMFGGRLKLDDAQRRQMDRVLYGVLNTLLAIVAVPILLFTWGFSGPEITALFKSAIFGFDVGGIHIAPTRILLAIALFVALLFATRLIQRWLKATLLQPSRIDSGLANSIHTGVGYAGYALAALAAISYGGLDITNLAIVAGALSVGIGFGLQSIVNNFVSGLILLVERPIKVGDWIAVGAYEGHVRRISVRSTEIETFDRSSVIVPNSELISGTVRNRTHRNALGRVEIAVGVSYASDPERVKELLEKVVQESPMVLKFPAPLISFDNFGASSLDFTVRAYLSDVNKSVSTATDLRIRIFKALGEAGIEIPFPQQDVHLRDLDFVKATVARMAAERAANSAKQANANAADESGQNTPPGASRHNLRNA